MTDYLEKNLAFLAARSVRSAALADRIRAATPTYEIAPARSGEPTARREGRFVLSPRDPAREAARATERLSTDSPAGVVILGFGLGYLLEAARRAAPQARAYLGIASVAGALRSALAARDLSEILSDPRVHLLVAREADFGAFADLLDEESSVRHVVIPEAEVIAEDPAAFRAASRALAEVAEVRQKSLATIASFAALWTRRLLENAELLAASQGWDALLGARREGRPMGPLALAAAGPSLPDALGDLSPAAAERILSVDTALPVLAARGFAPFLAVAADAQRETAGHFDAADGFDRAGRAPLALAATPFVPREVLDRFNGARRLIVPIEDPTILWYLRRLGIEAPPLRVGGSVITIAWGIARAMGADPILLLGADFSYGATTHAPGTAYDDWRTLRVSRFASRESIERDAAESPAARTGEETLAQYARWMREEIEAATRAGGPEVRSVRPTAALGLLSATARDLAALAEAGPIEIPPPARRPSVDAEAVRREAREGLAAARDAAASGKSPEEILAAHGDGPAGFFFRPLVAASEASPDAARSHLARVRAEIEAIL